MHTNRHYNGTGYSFLGLFERSQRLSNNFQGSIRDHGPHEHSRARYLIAIRMAKQDFLDLSFGFSILVHSTDFILVCD